MLPYAVEQRVAELKQENETIIAFPVENIDGAELIVIARLLTMEEVSVAMDMHNRSEESANRWVTETAVDCIWNVYLSEFISPEDIPMGMYGNVVAAVLPPSSMMDTNSFVNELSEYRAEATSVFYGAAAFIMKAFSSYTPDKLRKLTRRQFAEIIILAEQVHQVPFELVDPSTMQSDDSKNKKILDKIGSEADVNSKYIDFGAENKKLADSM